MYETVGIGVEDRTRIAQLMYDHELTKGEAIAYYYLVQNSVRRPCDVCHMTGAYPAVVNMWRKKAVRKMEAEANGQ